MEVNSSAGAVLRDRAMKERLDEYLRKPYNIIGKGNFREKLLLKVRSIAVIKITSHNYIAEWYAVHLMCYEMAVKAL